MQISDKIRAFARSHAEEAISLLKELAVIPAPSLDEGRRAHFLEKWLTEKGADRVETDAAGNVLFPLGWDGRGPCAAAAAHMDTVFPDRTDLPLREENGRLYCPGIGDDTANLVALLMAWLYFKENEGDLPCPLLFAADTGEEGLGNLAGMRQLFADHGGQIDRFLSLDLTRDKVYASSVGAERYRITVKAEGGHSYHDFGRPGAIRQMAALIGELSAIEVPKEARTTWNIGRIEGGTGVNVIPEECVILYEYRSESAACLSAMRQAMEAVLRKSRDKGLSLTCETLGIRPCESGTDREEVGRMAEAAKAVLSQFGPVTPEAASTDANIPLSLGISALTFGTCVGGGAHTREEWVETASLESGMIIAVEGIRACFAREERS